MKIVSILGGAALALGLGLLVFGRKKEESPEKPSAPPPPPDIPIPTVQGVGEWDGERWQLGQTTTYVVWRLFRWDEQGKRWLLQDSTKLELDNGPYSPWPLLLTDAVFSEFPPYYYSDSWIWRPGWDRWHFDYCITTFKSVWCN